MNELSRIRSFGIQSDNRKSKIENGLGFTKNRELAKLRKRSA
jgi:hypothetical protein